MKKREQIDMILESTIFEYLDNQLYYQIDQADLEGLLITELDDNLYYTLNTNLRVNLLRYIKSMVF